MGYHESGSSAQVFDRMNIRSDVADQSVVTNLWLQRRSRGRSCQTSVPATKLAVSIKFTSPVQGIILRRFPDIAKTSFATSSLKENSSESGHSESCTFSRYCMSD